MSPRSSSPLLAISAAGFAVSGAAAIGAQIWMTRPSGDEVAIQAAARNLRSTLSAAPDAPYLRDRARRIEGRIKTLGREATRARVRIYSALQIAAQIRRGLEQRDLRNVLPQTVPQHVTIANTDGSFCILDPELGHKIAIFEAEHYAPARVEEILVRDGVFGAPVAVDLEPAERTEVMVRGAEAGEALEVLPIYAGYWPNLDWQALSVSSALTIERRNPDGFPLFVAVRRHGNTTIHPLHRPPSAEAFLDLTDEWQPGGATVRGDPDLVLSTSLAIQAWLGRAEMVPDGVDALEESSTLRIKALRGFARVVVEPAAGFDRTAYTDLYGEVTFRGLTPGACVVRAFYRDRSLGVLSTLGNGVYLGAGSTAAVELFPIDDVLAGEEDDVAVLVFVLDEQGAPLANIPVNLIAQSGRTPPQRKTTDVHGFVRFRGLSRNTGYHLAYRRAADRFCLSHEQEVQPVEGQRWIRVDLRLPSQRLRIQAPPELSGAGGLNAWRRVEGVWARVWIGPLTAGETTELQSVAPGRYRLDAGDAKGKILATCEVEVAVNSPTTTVAATAWKQPEEEPDERR